MTDTLSVEVVSIQTVDGHSLLFESVAWCFMHDGQAISTERCVFANESELLCDVREGSGANVWRFVPDTLESFGTRRGS